MINATLKHFLHMLGWHINSSLLWCFKCQSRWHNHILQLSYFSFINSTICTLQYEKITWNNVSPWGLIPLRRQQHLDYWDWCFECAGLHGRPYLQNGLKSDMAMLLAMILGCLGLFVTATNSSTVYYHKFIYLLPESTIPDMGGINKIVFNLKSLSTVLPFDNQDCLVVVRE